MEAERVFGKGQFNRLEPLIVTMSHPDSVDRDPQPQPRGDGARRDLALP